VWFGLVWFGLVWFGRARCGCGCVVVGGRFGCGIGLPISGADQRLLLLLLLLLPLLPPPPPPLLPLLLLLPPPPPLLPLLLLLPPPPPQLLPPPLLLLPPPPPPPPLLLLLLLLVGVLVAKKFAGQDTRSYKSQITHSIRLPQLLLDRVVNASNLTLLTIRKIPTLFQQSHQRADRKCVTEQRSSQWYQWCTLSQKRLEIQALRCNGDTTS
jgi:hypothetical protein